MAFLALLIAFLLSAGFAASFFLTAKHMSESGSRPTGPAEESNGVYLLFHEVIARHHSEEIKSLQREIGLNLQLKAEEAISRQQSLAEVDPDLHLQVSALTDYYDSLGMSLQNNWNKVPEEMSGTMKELLHDAVIRDWNEFEKYKVQIQAEPARASPAGFQWLYTEMQNYRKEKVR